MNWLDILLLVSAASFGYSGFRQGFVVGSLAFAGFAAGGIGGLLVAPSLVSGLDPGLGQSVLAVAVVLLAASIGQVLLAWLGSLVRDRLTWRPARVLDAGMGALVSVLAMLLVTWFLASALRPGPMPSLSRQISDSQVITAVDQVVPDEARTLFSSFRRVLDDEGLPTVFGGLAPERIRPVEPPAQGITGTQAVRRAGTSVVKVTGTAPDCNRRLEGTGFVFSDNHVLTNAHVVAGVERPSVQIGGTGRTYRARVVVFDPRRDLAVLHAPELGADPLDLDPTAERGDQAVVAGFPGGGSYRLEAARVRDIINARGPDIYHRTQVTREVFSLYATVEPGNSGGPLLDLDGDVLGVIFAKSLDDANTGYALTIDEVRPVVRAGRDRIDQVRTGTCV
ncbi:MAG TPA: MarP family serine protease [Actinomycetes bacterium]